MGELSDHATYAFTARRLSLPRFFCNLRTILSILQIWARTNTEDETPRTNTADEHRGRTLFLFRSLGALPVTDRGCATQGTDPLPPSPPIRLAKDICCVAKKRVFTRKASLPCLPGDVSRDRHAAGDRHWPSFTGGCAVGVEKGRKLDSVRTGGNSKVDFRLPCEA